MVCKKCGKEVKVEWTTCPNCGMPIENGREVNVIPQYAGKGKKPFYKKWWFVLIVVIVLLFIVIGMGSDETNSSGDTNGQSNSQESIDAEIAEYTVSELYAALQNDENVPFIISEKAKTFLMEHEDYFPTTNYNHIASMVDTALEYRYVEKNASEYGDKLMELSELYVISISEESMDEQNKFTEIQAVDIEDNVYLILYIGAVDIFKEDIIKAVALPLGTTSYENVSGGTTNALVVAGSYLEKIDTAAE